MSGNNKSELNPALSVIGRTENATGAADDIRSHTNVTIQIDLEATFVNRKQTVVHLLPCLTAIGRAKHPDAVRGCEQGVTPIDSYWLNLRRD
jgi:hypothetical protein